MYALSILAQDTDNSSGGGGIAQLLILLLIPVAMYFLMIRPQRKRIKDQAALQSSLGVGDEVVTNSGIFGVITGEESDRFWLEIDDDVQIQIAKVAIQGKVKKATTDELPAGNDDADENVDES